MEVVAEVGVVVVVVAAAAAAAVAAAAVAIAPKPYINSRNALVFLGVPGAREERGGDPQNKGLGFKRVWGSGFR